MMAWVGGLLLIAGAVLAVGGLTVWGSVLLAAVGAALVVLGIASTIVYQIYGY